MTTARSIRFGVVGLHGFSRSHIGSIQRLEQTGAPVKLAAAVAYARGQDEAYAASLEAAGVRLVPDVDTLLALKKELNVVTVPVGIALHVPMAEKALQAGYSVYLEKPVTGAIQDFDRLAAVERQTPGPLFIGFQDIFQPSLWELKRRLIAGELGSLRRAVVMAAWPRPRSYYARNAWAGRLSMDGTWVLDSPLNNACAHFINLVLFLAGADLSAAACPMEVTAELYRANPIESADTTAVRVRTAEGVDIVFVASHACELARGPVFRLECEGGEVTGDRGKVPDNDWHLHRRSGQADRIAVMPTWADPFEHVALFLRGEKPAPICSLAMARPHTLVVNGAHLSSPIHDIPAALCGEVTRPDNDGQSLACRFVKGMNDCLNACFEKGCLPSESGAAGWARPGNPVDVSQLTVFFLPK
ncbi:MAG: Gfo/Idh/MocA family oxidoreductase [Verrucomicrobia bacterium]|nr:Gfo/Idh/MocA family oxidoreductase [Verrucomicrobiota bacterium]MCG2679418.1 Gfo/Idh/MocA family oxidoreductase [Kiritimatiellia bacterium]MBU4247596.1 Gfo/Idh/MocA family oxidoreductase [Verrucomicrobiota bacterium]MBU4289853.1 Gfo/Idh/MocA family oxidoreductase [Verrucomicrobiota bacterium]MBU4428773.1 Gfo/Idh/MocA family oxidoreductase [Verrucomicrobiota bacterium]